MQSLRSRLFLFVLRHGHLLRGRLRRRALIDWDTSVHELRGEVAKSARLFAGAPKGVAVSPVDISGMEAEWLRPAHARREGAILYFHGGGYVLGNCREHRRHVAKFVAGSGLPALVFSYRLAPEHPFPAALEDALSAHAWLLDQGISPREIVFAGDSAGGGLCLATLLALRDQGRPLPGAAAVLSPWTDLTCSGETYRSKLKAEPLAPTDSWRVFSHYYTGGQDPAQPYISPLFGDPAGLPPLMIHVGENEVMQSDSTRFADQARRAGVEVHLRVAKGMFHCFPVCAPLFPEATRAMAEICAFLQAPPDGRPIPRIGPNDY